MYTPMHSSTIEATPNPKPSLTEHTEALCSEMYPGICDIPVSACRGGGLAAVALSYLTTWPLPLSGLLGSRPTVAVPPHPFSEHPQRVVEVEVPIVAAPTSAREAADFMTVTAACIADGSIALHDHKRVYQGVRALLHAFDRTHPGGLERLMGGR